MVFYIISKKASKYDQKYNHTLWTNLRHCEEGPQNTNSHKTSDTI